MRECHSRVTELTVEGIGECVRNGHHLPGTNLDGPSETNTLEEEDYRLSLPLLPLVSTDGTFREANRLEDEEEGEVHRNDDSFRFRSDHTDTE